MPGLIGMGAGPGAASPSWGASERLRGGRRSSLCFWSKPLPERLVALASASAVPRQLVHKGRVLFLPHRLHAAELAHLVGKGAAETPAALVRRQVYQTTARHQTRDPAMDG